MEMCNIRPRSTSRTWVDQEKSQNYRVYGFCPSSSILKIREHNVSETGSVSCLPLNLRMKTNPVSETLCSLVF
jgi:hypothetical protein